MRIDLLFWGIAALMVLGCLVVVFAPLLRGRDRGGRRASYDMQVYRDQLREIDADLTRGVLGADEAERTRLEVSRKLLATADDEAIEPEAAAAPRLLSRAAGAAMVLALVVLAGALYSRIGAVGLPDQPLRARIAERAAAFADRPGQADAEAMLAARGAAPAPTEPSPEDAHVVARLQQVLEDRPDDVEGHRLLALSLGALGRFSEAHAAQARVIALLGEEASAEDRVDYAELMILATRGFVSPEAEAQLALALAAAPEHPRGRYYSGLALLQAGRPDLTYPIWTGLLAEGPPDAPWIGAIAADIAEVAQLAGRPAPRIPGQITGDTPARGPSRAEIEATSEMSAEDRAAMIGGMVDQLSTRLAESGGPPEDWAQLIRSLGVLGRTGEADAIWTEAQRVFSGNPAGLAAVQSAARDAGLVE